MDSPFSAQPLWLSCSLHASFSCALWFCRSPLNLPLAYSIMVCVRTLACVRAHSPCPLCSARLSRLSLFV